MTRLLVDAMCGTLATYLRMCGYDAAYALDRDAEDDETVLAWARDEGRAVITRDATLAGRAGDAVLLEARDVESQLAELAEAGFVLELPANPERCGRCNGILRPAPDDEPRPADVPSPDERPAWHCPECGQHFWRGSHWADVRETLATVLGET